MNAKKIICLLLAVLMGLSVLVGCGIAASSSTPDSGSSSATPTFDYSAGLAKDGHFEGIEAGDYLTLPAYKGIEIPAATSTAKEEEVQAQIDKIAQQFTTTEQVKDRAVADGDTLNIDYVGKVDGTAFDGGSTDGKGTSVTIGTTQYIDDFIDQLIGHKPGETFDVNVTFPDEYSVNKEVEGKDAVFVTTINYIEKKVVPTVDDAFVKTNFEKDYGFTTVQDMRDDLSKSMIANQEQVYLWTQLAETTEFKELPEQALNFQKNLFIENQSAAAAQYGMDVETFMGLMGYDSVEALVEENKQYIEDATKEQLLVLAIARAEKMTVEEKELKEFFGTEDYKSAIEYYGEPFVKLNVLQYKVTTLLMDSAARA